MQEAAEVGLDVLCLCYSTCACSSDVVMDMSIACLDKVLYDAYWPGVELGAYSCKAGSLAIIENRWCTCGARDWTVCCIGCSGCKAALRMFQDCRTYYHMCTMTWE